VNGAKWFNTIGAKTKPRTAIFALTGKVNNTGLVEVPMGITLGEIIFDIGGGIPKGKNSKAVQTGGPLGGCIPPQHLNVQVDFDSLQEVGAVMGSGGMIVVDEDTCMVEFSKFFLNFAQAESCGNVSLAVSEEGACWRSSPGSPKETERWKISTRSGRLPKECRLGLSVLWAIDARARDVGAAVLRKGIQGPHPG